MAKPEQLPINGSAIGVDVGVIGFVNLSNGEELEIPRHLPGPLGENERYCCERGADNYQARPGVWPVREAMTVVNSASSTGLGTCI